MARERFLVQARLLVRLLPLVAQEDVFALKGGTAIGKALGRIRRGIESNSRMQVHQQQAHGELRLHIQHRSAGVKIEVSPVLRGTVHQPVIKRTTATVEEELGLV